jgi:IPT/TIG domain
MRTVAAQKGGSLLKQVRRDVGATPEPSASSNFSPMHGRARPSPSRSARRKKEEMLTKAGVAPDRLPFRRRLLSALTIVATLASSLAALAPTVSAATGPTPTAVSLDLSTAAAGATEVTYTLQFTLPSSGALVANRGVISLAAPKGTFTDQSCSVCLTLTDLTTKASELVPGWRTTTNSDGSELSFTTPIDLGAGDIVRAVLPGLNNAAQPGLHDFSVGTSVSGTTTDRFQAVPASSIKDLSLSRSSALQGATNVTYTVTFQASMSGALPVGSGTVTVAGPVGTFSFPVAGCDNRFTITDVTSGASGTATFCLPVAKTDGGVVVLTTPVAIAAGDEVRVVMPSLHNGTQGADQLMVGTSSDTASSVALGGSTKLPVADVTVSATTAAARATEVTYTVGFTTSGTGALAPGLGTITLHMAPGTFPVPRSRCGSATATITDLATKVKAEGDLCEFATVSTDGAQVELVTQFQIGAGQAVQVVIGGLHNPDVPGTQTVSVSTSSDTAASASYHITGVGIPITALSVGLSSPAAAATRVTYTLDFTTSAQGALPSGAGDITVSAPAGTFPLKAVCGQATVTVTDLATKASGENDLCLNAVSGDGSQLQLNVPVAIGDDQRVQLAISGLANPLAPRTWAISVATSSNSSKTALYRTVAGSSLSGAALTVPNPSAGRPGVSYAATFTVPSSGELVEGSGVIYLSASPGTFPARVAPSSCAQDNATVTDLTTMATGSSFSCSVLATGGRASLAIVTPVPIGPGDKVAVAVTGLSNPATVGPQSVWLSTSSSGRLVKVVFRTQPAGPIAGSVRDSVGNPVPGAELQACPPKGGQCFDTTAGPMGAFSDVVPYGGYVVSSFPPPTAEGSALATYTASSPVLVDSPSGVAGNTVVMRVLRPLPGHVNLNGYAGGVPTMFQYISAPFTARGCPYGVGIVTMQGTDTQTGRTIRKIVPLLEDKPGSGRYSATIPPPWPIHGPSTFSYWIYCLEAVSPEADVSSGGNIVTIHGTGFTDVTAVHFGATPAPMFKALSSSLVEAVAPPGSGTVRVSVTNAHGTTGGGPLSAYTYISLASIIPAYGPAKGSTTVVLHGENLSKVDSLWFGGRPATDVRLLSNNELEADTPPGRGRAPVGIGQIGFAPLSGLKVAGPNADLFFSYGAKTGVAGTYGGAMLPATADHLAEPALAGRLPRSALSGKNAPDIRYADGAGPVLAPLETPFAEPSSGSGSVCGNLGCGSSGTPAGGSWEIFTDRDNLDYAGTTVATAGVVDVAAGAFYLLPAAVLGDGLVTSLTAAAAFGPALIAVGTVLIIVGGLFVLAGYAIGESSFSVYIDPSGTVFNSNGVPVRGATAVLEQAPTPDGPFSVVKAASPGVQPHRNPEKTGADGQFHWDVISDYYKIVASAPGCHAPGEPSQKTVSTPALPVPPPQTGLAVVLQCAHQAPALRPVVASLSASEALDKGGAEIQVLGSNFTPSAKVNFGHDLSPAVVYESPEALMARVPAGTGVVSVSVATQGGSSGPSSGGQLTYRPAPVVTKVSPSHGRPAGGTKVTIYGAGLSGAVVVGFGAKAVAGFTVTNDGAIEVTAPPGAPGTLDVTVTTAFGTSAVNPGDRYSYRPLLPERLPPHHAH